MNTNRHAIDLALEVSRVVLPQGLFCRLSRRLIEWEAGRRLDRLARLPSLGADTAAELSRAETHECVDRCRITTSRIQTYLTRLEVREGVGADVDRDPVVGVTWDAIVIRPDRLHVRQIAGDDYDEWITVGDSTWETMALQLGLSDQEGVSAARAPVNRLLRITRCMQLLTATSPTLGRTPRFRGRRMTYLDWDPIPPEAFKYLATTDSEMFGEGRVRHASMKAWMWQDGRLARFDLVLTNDDDSSAVLSQKFAMYDYPFQIADPSEGGPS